MEDKHDGLQHENDDFEAAAAEAGQPEELRDGSTVEPFSPSDYFYGETGVSVPKKKKRKRRSNKRRKIVWTAALGMLLVGLVLAGFYVYRITYQPSTFFAAGPTATPESAATAAADSNLTPSPTPVPTPTPSELDLLTEQADDAMMSNILNVAVIGVDYAEERETWGGKHEYHADVIMILAVNFSEKRVDLISVPRDTYANIPGVQGIYKINASINCGGGFEAEGGAGFLKTCETVSWMLGGIPVDYYYAVTMPAVKQLVDAFGGVDYDLEMSFTMAGRKYYKGQQHMNGQGVLDYLRVRKNLKTAGGDLNRINRQKDMMVALFNQMKKNNLIVKIPQIISAFDGQLFTNCTLSQTAALARFAYDLDSENIGMHSMDGTMRNIFGWNFVLTDQEKRVEIIKDVYDIDVPVEKEYTSTYAQYRWQSMLAEKYLATTKSFRARVIEEVKNGSLEYDYDDGGGDDEGYDDSFDEGIGGIGFVDGAMYRTRLPQIALRMPILPSGALSGYSETAYNSYVSFIEAYNDLTETLEYAHEQAEKYRNDESNKLSSAASSLTSDNNALKTHAVNTAGYFDISTSFNWSVIYWKDTDFNEVLVDFR